MEFQILLKRSLMRRNLFRMVNWMTWGEYNRSTCLMLYLCGVWQERKIWYRCIVRGRWVHGECSEQNCWELSMMKNIFYKMPTNNCHLFYLSNDYLVFIIRNVCVVRWYFVIIYFIHFLRSLDNKSYFHVHSYPKSYASLYSHSLYSEIMRNTQIHLYFSCESFLLNRNLTMFVF